MISESDMFEIIAKDRLWFKRTQRRFRFRRPRNGEVEHLSTRLWVPEISSATATRVLLRTTATDLILVKLIPLRYTGESKDVFFEYLSRLEKVSDEQLERLWGSDLTLDDGGFSVKEAHGATIH